MLCEMGAFLPIRQDVKCEVELLDEQNQGIQRRTTSGVSVSPLLWLVYCNDIHEAVTLDAPKAELSLFADDSALTADGRNEECSKKLQPALDAVASWCRKWKVSLSPEKCCQLLFSLDPKDSNGKKSADVSICGHKLEYSKNPVFVGLALDGQLNLTAHAERVKQTMKNRRQGLSMLTGWSTGASKNALRTAYIGTVRAAADYGSAVWMNMASASTRSSIEQHQTICARIVSGCIRPTRTRALLAIANLPPLKNIA